MATPVKGKESLVGVLGVDLAITSVVSSLSGQTFGGLGFSFLVNGEGKVLVSPDERMQSKGLKELYGQRIDLGTRQMHAVSRNGNDQLLYFVPIQGLPGQTWYLGVEIDSSKAFADLRSMRTAALIAIALTILCISLLLWVCVRRLTAPLRTMGEAMNDISTGEGDLTRRLGVLAQDEFGEMAQSFNGFAEKIQTVLISVRSVAEGVGRISGEVAGATNATLSNAAEQSSRAASVAAAIHELRAAAGEIAGNASQASKEASWAKEASLCGQGLVEQSTASMRTLSSNLALSQSNILALSDQAIRRSTSGRSLMSSRQFPSKPIS